MSRTSALAAATLVFGGTLAANAAVVAASTTFAPATAARPGTLVRVEPLKRLFPLLDLYYRIVPARRTRFRIAYRLHDGERGAPVRVTLVDDTATPWPISADGWFARLPTADELASSTQVRIETQAGAKFGLSLVPEMSGPIDSVMDAATIVAAVDQLDAQVHSRNPIGLLVPHFGRVQFHGGQGAMLVAASGGGASDPVAARSAGADAAFAAGRQPRAVRRRTRARADPAGLRRRRGCAALVARRRI